MNSIVLCDKTWDRVNDILKVLKQILEFKVFKLSKIKIEYLKCKFGVLTNEVGVLMNEVNMEVRLATQSIPKKENFNYLGSVIQNGRDIWEKMKVASMIKWEKRD